MKVFVAGATGAIGRPLVGQLVEAGHEVVAMTRSPERAARLRRHGVEARVADVYDREAVRGAVAAAKPEVLVHELTDIPAEIDPRRFAQQFRSTDRLRTEGTRNLLDAAKEAGVKRFVAQSVFSAYEPTGGPIKTEVDPLWADPPDWAAPMRAVADLERVVLESEAVDGVTLRYGYFYGPGTQCASDGALASRVRRRMFPVPARATALMSFVHVEDAASATVLAVDRGPPGAYNVVDDEPAPVSEWLPVFAEAVGAPRPLRVPKLAARLGAGPYGVHMLYEQRGASNEKARRDLGWTLTYPSWRQGFQQALG